MFHMGTTGIEEDYGEFPNAFEGRGKMACGIVRRICQKVCGPGHRAEHGFIK
jgi:hypothetical protein